MVKANNRKLALFLKNVIGKRTPQKVILTVFSSISIAINSKQFGRGGGGDASGAG